MYTFLLVLLAVLFLIFYTTKTPPVITAKKKESLPTFLDYQANVYNQPLRYTSVWPNAGCGCLV